MIREILSKLVERQDLTEDESFHCVGEIMNGQATPAQIAAYLTAMRMKGETVDEIVGAAKAMRKAATTVAVQPEEGEWVVDTCGTGGDGAHIFNLSTAAAFVVAGAGVRVAKHGNRSVSSRTGSADLLEALGVNIQLDAAGVAKCLETTGMAFMFAQIFHPAMRHAGGPRKEMGIRTLFNLLGPLTNPAGADAQLVGVFNSAWVIKMAQALERLGIKKARVVCGEGHLDEVSPWGKTMVAEMEAGKGVVLQTLSVEQFALPRVAYGSIPGGDAAENAKILKRVLAGNRDPYYFAVVMNAAVVLDMISNHQNLKQAAQEAETVIQSGKARQALEGLVDFTQELKKATT